MISRRAFLGSFALGVLAPPLAEAQPAGKIPHVGVLPYAAHLTPYLSGVPPSLGSRAVKVRAALILALVLAVVPVTPLAAEEQPAGVQAALIAAT